MNNPLCFMGQLFHISTQNDSLKKIQISCTFSEQSYPSSKCSVVFDIQIRRRTLIDISSWVNCLCFDLTLKN